MSTPAIAPSLLAADAARLGEEIRAAQEAGADWLHMDVMDGHFVPNLSFGPHVLRAIRRHSRLPVAVHLMIERPEASLAAYIEAGAHEISVHSEACVHLYRTLTALRGAGVRPGVALNPGTPVAQLVPVLGLVDQVLLMSVNPGFGGQRFLPEAPGRIAELAELRRRGGGQWRIEVDGGIDLASAAAATRAGADALVAGSAIFGTSDYAAAIAALRAAGRAGA